MVNYSSKKVILFWAGLLLAQFVIFYIFSKIHAFILFAERFFEYKKLVHQKVFSQFNFSIGDIAYFFLCIVLIYFLLKLFNRKQRANSIKKILIILNIFYFVYQLTWGMLYFQTPLSETLSKEPPRLEEAKLLAIKYLTLCKKDRSLAKEDKNGIFKIYDMRAIETEILRRQNELPEKINTKKAVFINSFKPSSYKNIMSYTGILGYYNPFTAEAQYNENLPSTYTPFTLAHESSHQLGYAREQEANFIGYLIGKDSKNINLRYSTEYFVLKSLLNLIAEKDEIFVKKALGNYNSGMKRDYLYEKAFVHKHSGMLENFFEISNDLFLKSNQQDGNISYSYFIDLLIRYERGLCLSKT